MFKDVYVQPSDKTIEQFHDEKISMILRALQMSSLQIPMLAPDFAPPSTSQPLRLADTQ
ncbi:hypothetical protein D8674_024335 [Pyrus ussuriensis x Pyrus communis]|uniref:Uncharacterized protein n=1 Tax=Pyrus ussuriensis x Pyrus communis TaxID=2448454 RepID=A0A5N5H6C0_9ROSA|nr:hypothetical protein D8674_024335 [Pyrus ussuriensis x Pyrus communis]